MHVGMHWQKNVDFRVAKRSSARPQYVRVVPNHHSRNESDVLSWTRMTKIAVSYHASHPGSFTHLAQHPQRRLHHLARNITRKSDLSVPSVATQSDEETASYLIPTLPAVNPSERRRSRGKTWQPSWTIWISKWKIGAQLKKRLGDSGAESSR